MAAALFSSVFVSDININIELKVTGNLNFNENNKDNCIFHRN